VASVVSNGQFSLDLTSWTPTLAAWVWDGHTSLGCCEMQPTAIAAANVFQYCTMPGTVVTAGIQVRLRFSIKAQTGAVPVALALEVSDSGGNVYFANSYSGAQFTNTWLDVSERFAVKQGASLKILFSVVADASVNRWRIDDVGLDVADPSVNSCDELAQEMRRLRHDMMSRKHAPRRYKEIVNQALADAPMTVWQLVKDESVTLYEGELEYDLGGLASLTNHAQVLRLWQEDADTDFHQIGHWEILDVEGYCVLMLDTDPIYDGGTLRLEYLKPWDQLDTTDPTDTTACDREWLLAKAMTLLYMEANIKEESEKWIMGQVQAWDDARKKREAKIGHRRPVGKVRSRPLDPPYIIPRHPGMLGLGTILSADFLPLHNLYPTTFVAAAATAAAAVWYPQWPNKHRCFTSTSLAGLAGIALAADTLGIPYESLGYNLESTGVPAEVADPVGSFVAAHVIATFYGKPLMAALGGQYADDTVTDAQMASLAAECEWYLLQNQRQQVYPPGMTFRHETRSRIARALAGHAHLQFVVQESCWAGYVVTSAQMYAWIKEVQRMSRTLPIKHCTLLDAGHDPAPPAIITGAMQLYYG
jgi:hypothetical protein